MGNSALRANANVARHGDLEITTHGSDWYFTICSIMGVSAMTVMALALRKPRSQRIFHYISAMLLWTATIAYFAMGSNLGQVPILAQFTRPDSSQVREAGTREIFYARYIDWFVTTPLLLLDLMLTAGMPWPNIIFTILADEIMIVTGLIGALTSSPYKWGFWTFGMFAFFYVVYSLVFDGYRHARVLGGRVKNTYFFCGVVTIGVWFLYPVAWGLSEGGNVIHPDSEAIFYGILDLIAKPVFTAMLLYGHHGIDPRVLGIHVRDTLEEVEKNGRSTGHKEMGNGLEGGRTGPDGGENVSVPGHTARGAAPGMPAPAIATSAL